MTFQTEIEAALAKPVDQELMEKALAVKEEVYGTLPLKDAFYTLLLRIRELEKQVEQERWRDATKEKPEDKEKVLCLCKDGAFTAYWDDGIQRWKDEAYVIRPTHWKPIKLPA